MTRPARGKRTHPAPVSWDFDHARQAAFREGLRLTPAERLAWLEETIAELESLVGRARRRPTQPEATTDPAK